VGAAPERSPARNTGRDNPDDCPDENQLVRLIEGSLSADAVRSLERHIDACTACGAMLDELAEVIAPAQAGSGERVRPDGCIGRYEVLGEVGAGAMGVVYAAYDPELRRKVALKVLRPDGALTGDTSSARARLLREARLLATVSHPNVVAVYDVGAVGDDVFIAVELVEGRSFAEWLHEETPRWREVAQAFAQVARGLGAAHASGLVHRDVKPANLLIGRDGRARVTDFGLATAPSAGVVSGVRNASSADTSLATRSGALVGTPAYMAPEQYAGRGADARSDQFSFCVSLGEALTGERPVAGATTEDLREAAATRTGAPAELLRTVARGLSARAADRHDDMEAVALAIDEALGLSSRSIQPPAPPPSQVRRALRSRRLAWFGWTIAGLLAAVAAYGWLRPEATRRDQRPLAPSDARVSTIEGTTVATATDDPVENAALLPDAARSIAGAAIAADAAPAPAGAASDPEGAMKALNDARRKWSSGDGQGCLADLGRVAQGDPALGSRSDVEKMRAQCQMFAGDCAGGRQRLAPLVGAGKSGKELEAALDAASIQSCRSGAVAQGGTPAFANKNQRLGKFYQDASAARAAGDSARCRALNAELDAYVAAEGIAAEAQLKHLAHAASHELTRCLAATNCDEARRTFEKKYRSLYPELMTSAEYDKNLAGMFYASYPQCQPKK
jgi:serine/threonine protein kinase